MSSSLNLNTWVPPSRARVSTTPASSWGDVLAETGAWSDGGGEPPSGGANALLAAGFAGARPLGAGPADGLRVCARAVAASSTTAASSATRMAKARTTLRLGPRTMSQAVPIEFQSNATRGLRDLLLRGRRRRRGCGRCGPHRGRTRGGGRRVLLRLGAERVVPRRVGEEPLEERRGLAGLLEKIGVEDPEVEEGVRIVRIGGQNLLQVGARLLELLRVLRVGLPPERGGEARLRLQVIGRDPQNLPVLLLGLGVRAGSQQDHAHVQA